MACIGYFKYSPLETFNSLKMVLYTQSTSFKDSPLNTNKPSLKMVLQIQLTTFTDGPLNTINPFKDGPLNTINPFKDDPLNTINLQI